VCELYVSLTLFEELCENQMVKGRGGWQLFRGGRGCAGHLDAGDRGGIVTSSVDYQAWQAALGSDFADDSGDLLAVRSQRDGAAEENLGRGDTLRAAVFFEVRRQRTHLLQRTEVRHLGNELRVRHRIHRILIRELGRQQFQEVALIQLLLGKYRRRAGEGIRGG